MDFRKNTYTPQKYKKTATQNSAAVSIWQNSKIKKKISRGVWIPGLQHEKTYFIVFP
jgi:hypothetical protein